MTVHDDLAILARSGLSPGCNDALDRVEAEIARLERERNEAREAWNERVRWSRQLKQRAEAAEAEIAQLRDGLQGGVSLINKTFKDRGAWLRACDRWEKKARALLAEDGAA